MIATHRHQDHISGFGETETCKGIGVEEVWLPFTARDGASMGDPALAALERLRALAPHVVDEKGKLTPSAANALGARSQEERDAAAFMLWNARENAPGIENLRRGLTRSDGTRAARRYLPADGTDAPHRFECPVLPGVSVHVLAPARDPKLRKKRKVPSTWDLLDQQGGGFADDLGSPFGPEWQVPASQLPATDTLPFKPQSLAKIRTFNDDLMAAAAAGDGFLNGESLVLLLEFGKARLLLTGDAEVGAWSNILANADALALVSSATFLKVGHHGSHNATPLVFLREHLSGRTPAMMSTQKGKGPYRNGIPPQELLDMLAAREMPFVRSDVAMPKATALFKQDAQERWIDCSLRC